MFAVAMMMVLQNPQQSYDACIARKGRERARPNRNNNNNNDNNIDNNSDNNSSSSEPNNNNNNNQLLQTAKTLFTAHIYISRIKLTSSGGKTASSSPLGQLHTGNSTSSLRTSSRGTSSRFQNASAVDFASVATSATPRSPLVVLLPPLPQPSDRDSTSSGV